MVWVTMNECTIPNELEAWKLDAYVDGLSLPEVNIHLEKCPACRRKLDEIRQENDLFSMALSRLQCPDTDQLLNYSWNLLDEETSLLIAVHLAKCPHCMAESERLAPSTIKEQTNDALSSLSIAELGQRVRLFVAQLLPPHPLSAVRFDRQMPLTTRGQVSSTKIYAIAELDLDIVLDCWMEADQTCTVQGQLLGVKPEQIESFQVSLLKDQTRVVTQPLSNAGVFTISSVKPDRYDLCFHTEQVQFCIPDISFPQS